MVGANVRTRALIHRMAELMLLSACGGFGVTIPVSPALARAAASADRRDFAIDQPLLEGALLQFAIQARVQISMRAEDVRLRPAPNVSGRMRPADALSRLLKGSGLAARWISSSNVVIIANTASQQQSRRVIARSALPHSGSRSAVKPITTEDIIVAARRRDEKLLDVPMSISTYSGDWLRRDHIGSLAELGAVAPALRIAPAPIAEQIYIRGAGSSLNSGFEQSVGTFVDGAYRGRSRSVRTALFDIERVEVLKGPQTTFFGNNAVAGAINVTTKKPGSSPSRDLSNFFDP